MKFIELDPKSFVQYEAETSETTLVCDLLGWFQDVWICHVFFPDLVLLLLSKSFLELSYALSSFAFVFVNA